MTPSDFVTTLRRAIQALEQASLRFHLTGGLVSSYYGEPRLTQDIDFVVALDIIEVKPLFDALTEKFMVDKESMLDAIHRQSLFQALDQETFLKVDFHVSGAIHDELTRSVIKELFDGVPVPIASKCDAIVSKLIWTREGSGKSRQDIIGMLLGPEPIDEELLNQLARVYEVADLLATIRKEANFNQ